MEEQHEPELTEEQKKHQEEHREIVEKINRVSKEIGDILAKEGLTLVVNHNIAIVPKRN
jgi:Skp family chaperone for outer membrane proteins